jgi:flavin reductase (DIM6/NTAB) family NADH-FMN oxidoreductase RutF
MSDAAAAPPDPERFRELMSRWPTGVSIVTSHADGADSGLTVNAFLSISLTPPMVLISLTLDAETTPIIQRSRGFAVNLLASRQRALSERFARRVPGREKFAGLTVHRGPTGSPLLDGTLVSFDCRVRQEVPAGDHVLLLGEVVRAEWSRPEMPLLFFRSQYAEPDPGGGVRLPEPLSESEAR